MDCDVLIVGAGPTGLMLANQLGRRGLRPLIIDRHAGPSQQTRALGVQARTLEIYAHLGIAERAIELGKRGTGANMWADGKKMARIPLGDIGRHVTPYPYILILGQDDNERIMGERLKDWDLAVQWNTEMVGLAQEPGHVTATLRDADGTIRHVDATWMAGCDGARSAVRELNGIGFPGAPYEHVFFVADVEMTGGMVPEEVNVYLWKSGFHLLFPMRGQDHWRIVGILPAELRDKEDVRFEDVIPSLHAEAGAGLSFKTCTWFSTYRIHHRSASRFRDRRCFLLGDAAHIHSPVGAQGMNTGLQDAYNLAWKLALVIEGEAGDTLLDSYEAERLPVARRLLETTDRGFRLVVSDAALRRPAAHPRAGPLRRLRDGARARAAAGVPHRVADRHPLPRRAAGDLAGRPAVRGAAAGDRFPWLQLRFDADGPVEDVFERLEDTHFHLVVFGQALPAEPLPALARLLHVHAMPAGAANDAELERH